MRTDRLKIIILLCSLALVLPFLCLTAEGKDFTVVIDPGHGGHDPGAIGRRGKEKNINLNVALKVGRLIQNNCKDVKVIFTRRSDVFIPLDRRAQIANNAKADLFISIHTNSVARGRNVRGTETYTLGLHRTEENLEVAKKENSVILIEDNYQQRYAGFNPNSSESYIIFEFLQDKNMEKSVKLATLIQKQFKTSARRIDKGVHQAGFLVLRETSMPGVLVELGYISTPDEEQYLLSDTGSEALANSIYKAFLNYKREHDAPIDRSKVQQPEVPEPEESVAETPTDAPDSAPPTADGSGQIADFREGKVVKPEDVPEIRSAVEKEYPGYTIQSVTHALLSDRQAYKVTLQGSGDLAKVIYMLADGTIVVPKMQD